MFTNSFTNEEWNHTGPAHKGRAQAITSLLYYHTGFQIQAVISKLLEKSFIIGLRAHKFGTVQRCKRMIPPINVHSIS